jgi:hypothetical protein
MALQIDTLILGVKQMRFEILGLGDPRGAKKFVPIGEIRV